MRDGGIQHSGSRPSASSSRRWRESVLAASGEGDTGRLGDVRRNAGRSQFLGNVAPAGAPLQRERDVLAAGEPRQPRAQARTIGRGDLAPLHPPGRSVEIVERELLPVDIQPAYDVIGASSSSPRAP